MNPANFIAVATALISALSVIAMSLQIRSNVKLNRNNQTFKKIEELDEILYHRSELRKIIKDIHLIDDCEKSLSIMEAGEILKDNDLYIYEILNFFESLSLSVISKNIDEKTGALWKAPVFSVSGENLTARFRRMNPKAPGKEQAQDEHQGEQGRRQHPGLQAPLFPVPQGQGQVAYGACEGRA